MGYIVVAVLAVAVAVFAMQNTERVIVKFLIWEIANVPVAAVVLASFGVGILVVGIPASFKLWRLRRRLVRAQAAVPPPADVPDTRPLAPPVNPPDHRFP